MANRMIKTRVRGGATQLLDCLASLFALELLAPGGRLYLISPRLGDMVLLDSPFGQFRALMPEIGQAELRLSDALRALAARGTQLRVLASAGEQQTEAFLSRLGAGVPTRQVNGLAERGLIGESFYLRGSLEFTSAGVAASEERVELTTDPAEVARALIEAEQMWRLS